MIMELSLLPITIVPTKSFQKKKIAIEMSPSLIHYWRIDIEKPMVISLGNGSVTVNILASNIAKDEILIYEDILKQLLLPIQNTPLIASFSQKEKTLTLGPVIGLLTDINLSEAEEPHFRSIHRFCHEMHDLITEIGGLFYVFSLRDYTEDTLHGYMFNGDTWIKKQVPIPHVIYNRIHSRKFEASPSFHHFKLNMLSHGIPLFNNQFLSKEEVHDLLLSEEYLHPHLPKTLPAAVETIEDLLNEFESVFIKPINGSQGRSIIKAAKLNNGVLTEFSTIKDQRNPIFFQEDQQFYKWIRPHIEHKPYIVQQGISLMKYKDNQLDFRILCHRNYQNTWKATSVVARISANQQFVSNLARGGQLMKPLQVLSTFYNRSTALQQLSLMKELAADVSDIISKNTEGLIGELGIDIGMDEGGKLWIIEANSKPSKNFNEDDHTKIRPSVKALLEYCTYLSFSAKS